METDFITPPPFDAPQRPLLLICPRCHTRKIDKGLRATFPHNDHRCPLCQFDWPHTRDWTVAVTRVGYIMLSITNWLIKKNFITKEIIGEECPELGPLLIRYKLFKSKRLGSVYFHLLLRTDPSPLHDHPWSFTSLILSSGYTEESQKGKNFYKPGTILHRPARWRHRLEIDNPAWTLVFAGPRKREWGFWFNATFIPFHKYNAKAELCPDD